jgi:hypothetical protein
MSSASTITAEEMKNLLRIAGQVIYRKGKFTLVSEIVEIEGDYVEI